MSDWSGPSRTDGPAGRRESPRGGGAGSARARLRRSGAAPSRERYGHRSTSPPTLRRAPCRRQTRRLTGRNGNVAGAPAFHPVTRCQGGRQASNKRTANKRTGPASAPGLRDPQAAGDPDRLRGRHGRILRARFPDSQRRCSRAGPHAGAGRQHLRACTPAADRGGGRVGAAAHPGAGRPAGHRHPVDLELGRRGTASHQDARTQARGLPQVAGLHGGAFQSRRAGCVRDGQRRSHHRPRRS